MDINKLVDFIEWYWEEIDGKPTRDSALQIAEWYEEDCKSGK